MSVARGRSGHVGGLRVGWGLTVGDVLNVDGAGVQVSVAEPGCLEGLRIRKVVDFQRSVTVWQRVQDIPGNRELAVACRSNASELNTQ